MTNIRHLDPSASPLDYYGSELRRLREAAALSVEDSAALIARVLEERYGDQPEPDGHTVA